MSTLSSLKKIRDGLATKLTDMDKVISEISSKKKIHVKNKESKARILKNGVNKSEEIRKFIRENPKCLNKEVVSGLKEKLKIDVNPAHVSIIRKNLEKSSKIKVQKATKVAKTKKSDFSGLSMNSICAKILGNNDKGLKLRQIAEIVQKSGYNYEGEKGLAGLKQNVYQSLNNLSKPGSHKGYKGSDPIVLKDKEKHLYRLNPKVKIA